jgi:DNA-binding CsgD family transcriptional regulator
MACHAVGADCEWARIHDFLLEVGRERDPRSFALSVMRNMSSLVPFDTGVLFFVEEAKKDVSSVLYGIDERWAEAYLEYYARVDGGRFSLESADIGEVSWADFRGTEYVTDFVRPQRYDHSATIKLFGSARELVGALGLNRSGPSGFGERDRRMLARVRPHLDNLHANLFAAAGRPDEASSAALPVSPTRREEEILRLLLRGLGPRLIGQRLCISPRTVEKHAESLYRKFGVASRHELIVKVLALAGEPVPIPDRAPEGAARRPAPRTASPARSG